MLDLSIPSLTDALGRKRPEEIEAFVHQRITVTEKFDGTKLTFLKTGPGKDEWLLAFKGNVLPRDLFPDEKLGDIRDRSRGALQYTIPLARFGAARTEDVPVGTEVFLEFIQRKPTVLCDYLDYHDTFVIDARRCEWHLDSTGTRLTTFPIGSYDSKLVEACSKALKSKLPPVLYEGRLRDPIPIGSKLTPARPATKHWNGDWSNYILALSVSLGGFESALGGKPEGVVIRTEDGRVMKAVRSDQCDREAREEKKARWRCARQADEHAYWVNVHACANTVVGEAMCWEPAKSYAGLRLLVDQATGGYVPKLPRRDVNYREDVLLTAKLAYDRACWVRKAGSIGVFPIAGKPFHAGHWKMVKRAAYENDRLLLIVSTADRENVSGGTMFRVWREMLEAKLPENVVLRFSGSPYNDAVHELQALGTETAARLSVYGDPRDIGQKWGPDVAKKRLPGLIESGRLWTFPISRESTLDISGTQMRAWLLSGDRERFCSNLPDCLIPVERGRYWELLVTG